jgi:DNA-directed RNA polymerase subunit RPC12/RpoP
MVEETYGCINCKKDVLIDINRTKKIICPYCGYRILKKKRAEITRKVIVK